MTALERKIASLRHGNPSKGMTVIVVAGVADTKVTATFLKGILGEAGRKAALLPDRYRHSINGFYTGLARAKKQGFTVAIVEADEALVRSGALKGVLIDNLVITSHTGNIDELLKLSPRHLVVPTSLEIPQGSVEPYQHITVGEEATSDAHLESVTLYRKGTELRMVIDHQTKLEIATQLVGRTNARYLATAIAAAYVSGVELGVVQEGVADVEPLEGQFERLELDKKADIYLEKGDAEAGKAAFASAKQLAKRRLVVAIDEPGVAKPVLEAAKSAADRLFVANYEGEVPSGVEVVESGRVAAEKALRAAQQDDLLLLYGSGYTEKEDDKVKARVYLEGDQ